MITVLLGTKFVKLTENIAKRCPSNAQKLGNSSIHEPDAKHGIFTEKATLLWRLWKQKIKIPREGARDAHAWENTSLIKTQPTNHSRRLGMKIVLPHSSHFFTEKIDRLPLQHEQKP